MKRYIQDKISISESKRKLTDEGFLLIRDARIARAGIYSYKAGEIGYPDKDPNEPVRVLRPMNNVFDEDSVLSFAMKPLTDGHPPEMLTIDNVKKYQVGHAGTTITPDGEYLKTDLLVTDAQTIRKINDGKRELSNGYEAEFDYVSGYTEAGEIYDAVMKNIRGNHIAIVDVARGGKGCRIDDHNPEGKPMKKYVIDELEIETSEESATSMDALVAMLNEAKAKVLELEAKVAEVQGTAAAQVDEMAGQLAEAQAAVPKPEDLDKMVEDRASLIADARTIAPDVEAKGLTDSALIEAVVLKVCDGLDVSHIDEAARPVYFRARFDALKSTKAKQIGDGSENIKIDPKKVTDEDPVRVARQRKMEAAEKAYKLGKD
jgi:uncharacterized protein